ncbi:MAG: 2-hydroxychromene-2-carboxylate isomerase [Cupriavidus sp.]|nr:MAG: 2-hydroxychromene-2-carboxylate isomerase [Cupriavidus sp.]
MSQTVEFFWEPGSPYTYLAATQIEKVVAASGSRVVWKPFLLGKVFEARGMKMPASIPAKASYMFKDLARWAQMYQVPVTMPSAFPISSLNASRAAIAASQLGHEADAAKAILHAYWGLGEDISQIDVLSKAFTSAGIDAAAIFARAQEQSVKDQLKENTEEALKRGVFGAPTMFIGDAMFWGNDRLDQLALVLAGKIKA